MAVRGLVQRENMTVINKGLRRARLAARMRKRILGVMDKSERALKTVEIIGLLYKRPADREAPGNFWQVSGALENLCSSARVKRLKAADGYDIYCSAAIYQHFERQGLVCEQKDICWSDILRDWHDG